MSDIGLSARLAHAVTAYDRTQAGKRGYNIYALPQYLRRVEQIVADVERGASVRGAVLAAFNGRLLAAVLRGIGEPRITSEELDAGRYSIVYRSVTEEG